MQTIYNTDRHFISSVDIALTEGAITNVDELIVGIKGFKRAAGGSVVHGPYIVQSDTVRVELDAGIEATLILSENAVEISAIDLEDGFAVDMVTTPEAKELMEYFETI